MPRNPSADISVFLSISPSSEGTKVRRRLIEQELESSADDVLDLQALKSLNLMVSLKLTELVEEIGKVCVIFPGFHKLCMDLSKIQQRLALDQ